MRQWIGVAFCLLFLGAAARAEQPQRVTSCALKKNPAAYNHKLIEVTAFVSHGFEDFALFDPACPAYPPIWLEYGGTVASGTMYCCGVSADRSRRESMVVEGIPISLLADQRFREFDLLVQLPPDRLVHATLVGHFFSGERLALPNGDVLWGGYGHMGCCSLLAIQRIVSVDPQGRTDLDYRASPDQPELGKAGCSFRNLVPLDSTAEALAAQQRAETEKGGGAFDDPQRVATTSLAKFLDVDHAAITGLKQVRKSAGRVLYEWKPKGKRKTYSVVASRPYWLSFYAKDPHRTAWVTIAAYEKSCN